MKLFVKNLFSKCEQICSYTKICWQLLKKFFMVKSLFEQNFVELVNENITLEL